MNNRTIAKIKDDILNLVGASNGIDDAIIAQKLDIDHLRINQLCLELEKNKHVSIQPLNLHSGTKLTILYLSSTTEGILFLSDGGYTKAYKLAIRKNRSSKRRKIWNVLYLVAMLAIGLFGAYNMYENDKLEKENTTLKRELVLIKEQLKNK